jgi:hypothetical protein
MLAVLPVTATLVIVGAQQTLAVGGIGADPVMVNITLLLQYSHPDVLLVSLKAK